MRRLISFLGSFTIQNKILAGFTTVVMLTGLIVVGGLVYLEGLRSTSADVVPNTAQLPVLQQFQLAMTALESDLDQYLVVGGQQARESVLTDRADAQTALTTLLETGESHTLEYTRDLEQVFAGLGPDLQRLIGPEELTPREANETLATIYTHFDTINLAQGALSSAITEHVQELADEQDAAIRDMRTLGLILGALVLFTAVISAVLVIRSVAGPLRELVSATTQIAGGDLSGRANVHTRDELGTLAGAFNDMAAQLQDIVGSLESRVQARTRDLQLAARVSEQVSTIFDPEVLLNQVVESVKETFGLYHAHVYLVDNTGDNLVLAAGAGEAGLVMKRRGHSIAAGAEASLVARASREKAPVVVPDTLLDESFLPNPLLPDTRSETAVPLMVGTRVLGVLDVQSEVQDRFDADMVSVLNTMGRQIAVAVDNARLFTAMERTSRHEQALGSITQAIQGAQSIDDVLQSAARELGKALRVPYTAIELKLEGSDPKRPVTVDLSEQVAKLDLKQN